MDIRKLSTEVVKGSYFLRTTLQDYTDEENLAEIIREVNFAINQIKETFNPDFFFIVKGTKKILVTVVIQKGSVIKGYVDLEYVGGKLGVYKAPRPRNYNKGLTYNALKKRIKPSVVALSDSQIEMVSEYLDQYHGLHKTFLATLKFDIDLSDETLTITALNGNKQFDQWSLNLKEE